MDLFQLLAQLFQSRGNPMGGGGWINPGFGSMPRLPREMPYYQSPYQSGFGSPGGDVFGRPQGGIPNNIPTGQPPLPQRPLGQVGGQMANTGDQNQMLQQYLASQNPQLAMRPPIDYRNGTRGMFAGNPPGSVARVGIFSR